jgi:hypothetical protein
LTTKLLVGTATAVFGGLEGTGCGGVGCFRKTAQAKKTLKAITRKMTGVFRIKLIWSLLRFTDRKYSTCNLFLYQFHHTIKVLKELLVARNLSGQVILLYHPNFLFEEKLVIVILFTIVRGVTLQLTR